MHPSMLRKFASGVCACQLVMSAVKQGVVGVISAVPPDVLCHAAVRARNSSVLLVACSDPDEMAGFAGWQDQLVQLQLTQVWQDSFLQCVLCLGMYLIYTLCTVA